ncbi:MAG: hypothetical protein PHY26_03765 [Bacilli bacterium]|jgi:uncharacterized 2Fe-2S/4Fe-4S cluster protein (DUF4445 family)|nr:hypothetical protein [Bacilli bacterium]
MIKIEKGESITLDTGKQYYIAEIVELDDKKYLYLVNNNEIEIVIGEVVTEGEDFYVETLTDRDKMFEIIKIVMERLKKEVAE